MTLRDPDLCRCGSRETQVLNRRRRRGFFTRRHQCVCGHRWTTYESRLNPKKVKVRYP